MSVATPPPSSSSAEPVVSRRARIGSYVLGGLAVAFMTFDASLKLLELPMALEGTGSLGYPQSQVFWIGVTQAILLVLYLVPRTSIFGAILWTGYLGGAVATHVRIENPLFTHVLFPTYVAAMLWGALWLREPRLRALVPLRSPR